MNFLGFLLIALGVVAFLKLMLFDSDICFIKKSDITTSIHPVEQDHKEENSNDTNYFYISTKENGNELNDIIIQLYRKDFPEETNIIQSFIASSTSQSIQMSSSYLQLKLFDKKVKIKPIYKYKNRAGSVAFYKNQLYINLKDNHEFDNKHVVIGRVVEGMELAEYMSDKKDIVIQEVQPIWLESEN